MNRQRLVESKCLPIDLGAAVVFVGPSLPDPPPSAGRFRMPYKRTKFNAHALRGRECRGRVVCTLPTREGVGVAGSRGCGHSSEWARFSNAFVDEQLCVPRATALSRGDIPNTPMPLVLAAGREAQTRQGVQDT